MSGDRNEPANLYRRRRGTRGHFALAQGDADRAFAGALVDGH